MEPSERMEELDRLFDILLVLLGIITAALFQFQTARLPLEVAAQNPELGQQGIYDEVNKQMIIWLRIFFVPLILLGSGSSIGSPWQQGRGYERHSRSSATS